MTVADDLEAARASLVMINPAPYNAEAPPAALVGDDHSHRDALRAQQLRGARRTTAPSRSAAPSASPTTLTLEDLRAMPAHDHTVTLECAGNGRLEMRPLPTGEPWGDFAVSTARWTGALLHEVLAKVAAGGGRRRAPRPRRRPRAVPPSGDPARDRPGQPHLHPFPAAGTGHRPGSGDPHRLRDERPAPRARPRCAVPADRPALVRRRLGEVAQTPRRPDRALHRRVPDRSLHLPVARPAARARRP